MLCFPLLQYVIDTIWCSQFVKFSIWFTNTFFYGDWMEILQCIWQWWNSLIISSLQASDPHPICRLPSLLKWTTQPVSSHLDTKIIGLYKYRAENDITWFSSSFIKNIFPLLPSYLCSHLTRHPSLPLSTW